MRGARFQVTPTAAHLAPRFADVGAFALGAARKDAALLASVDVGSSLQTSGVAVGTVLVEVYDTLPGNSQRLVNLSARNRVGTGSDMLIAGFSVTGTGNKRLLIRAAGPALLGFGAASALSNPKLEVFDSTSRIAENDNWDASLASTFATVGAPGFSPGSRDSALILSVGANRSYTVQVSGADGGTGDALIEVYELP